MEPTLNLHIRVGSIYPEQSAKVSARIRGGPATQCGGRWRSVEGLPFDPSTRPLALLRIVVSECNESNHDFAHGTCAPVVQDMFTCNWGHI